MLAAGAVLACSAGAFAQFTPGHVYIADRPQEPCFIGPPSNPNDRIWDVDPVTGESELLVEVPDGLCGWISGLAFNPAGTHLRGSMFFPSTILEFDAAGGIDVALDSSDGIGAPIGSNNIAYDALGNFYVVNASTILRFPPDGGSPTVLADEIDLSIAAGAIDLFPNGDLLYGSELIAQMLFRISPNGTVTHFDTLPDPGFIRSVTIDSAGTVFVLNSGLGGQLYRYPGGDPAARELLVEGFLLPLRSSMTLSSDESSIYVANAGRLFSIDALSGSLSQVATIPMSASAGAGIAVYVPEPGGLAMLLAGAAALPRRVLLTLT